MCHPRSVEDRLAISPHILTFIHVLPSTSLASPQWVYRTDTKGLWFQGDRYTLQKIKLYRYR